MQKTKAKKLMLYRIIDMGDDGPGFDDEGDPFDHGALRAENLEEAKNYLRERFHEIFDDPFLTSVTVRIYGVVDTESGVLGNSGFEDVKITFPKEWEPGAKVCTCSMDTEPHIHK